MLLKLDDYKKPMFAIFWKNAKATGERNKTINGYLITWNNRFYPGFRVWQIYPLGGYIQYLKNFDSLTAAENYARSLPALHKKEK